MKQDFLNYIGPEHSLNGYQRSYKLIFFKYFFDLLDNDGQVNAYNLAAKFRNFYLQRKNKGLIVDMYVDPIIDNIETSSVENVYKLILKQPFRVITEKNYITLQNTSENDYFVLNPILKNEFTNSDLINIKTLIDKKIDYYYQNLPINKEGNEMKEAINKILNEYTIAKRQTFVGNPMGKFFRNDLPQIFFDTNLLSKTQYKITGSVGQGNWATVPWLCIFDRRITTTATKGVYIVYLLSKDGNSLYLTFNQGCTDIREQHSKQETINILHNRAYTIASKINSRGFNEDESISLGSNLTELAELYQNGTIFYKKYTKGNVPDEAELLSDLEKMLDIYTDYYDVFIANKQSTEPEQKEQNKQPEPGVKNMIIKDYINQIKQYISNKGFSYEGGLIENFYLSIKSKPFVILAGTSGTGKTRLIRLFAEAVGATPDNGRYKMVSVRPDWSDSSDLFGHVDLNGRFVPGVLIDFIRAAQNDLDKPYFLCLDEMNLARVEYYLSDILSIIETRNLVNDTIVTDTLIPTTYYGKDETAANKYGNLYFPENLYIIGTVNMDETTFPFSKKVLDRANTIEFSHVDLIPDFDVNKLSLQPLDLDNKYFKSDYLILADCKENIETVKQYCTDLQNINHILEKANAHFGYRVRDEIVFYLLNNSKNNIITKDAAFDNEIMQKILPRIQGSSIFIKNLLCDLFKLCAADFNDYQVEDNQVSTQMFKVITNTKCKYPISARKIAFMVRRFEEDGFTSFWF